MAASPKDPRLVHDLGQLINTGGTTTIYPNDDTLISLLHARFKHDLPATRIGATSVVIVNPLKVIQSDDDASSRDYVEKTYIDVSGEQYKSVQPHLYDLASRVFLSMRRKEQAQLVLFRGITGSGKTHSLSLITRQLLRLSTPNKKTQKISSQVTSMITLLNSFTASKTPQSPSGSRATQYLSLHFDPENGQLSHAQALVFGLDKSKLSKLSHESRTFHIFYQFLSGATPEERDTLSLEDASDYALLASSGCYRLPSGPFSDDAAAMRDVREAFKVLGFKPKHIEGVYKLLSTLLILGNIEFEDTPGREESCTITSPLALDRAARSLGVNPEDLDSALTNKTYYSRKEICMRLLDAAGARSQRDKLVADLYSLLVAYVVESANHKLSLPDSDANLQSPGSQIVLLDQAGFQSRSNPGSTASMPLLAAAYGPNEFTEFTLNLQDELVHSFYLRHSFEDGVGLSKDISSDGVTLPRVLNVGNEGVLELLRGGGLALGSSSNSGLGSMLGADNESHQKQLNRKPGGMLGIMAKAASHHRKQGGDTKDEELVQELIAASSSNPAFIPESANDPFSSTPTLHDSSRTSLNFGVNHYSHPVTYSAASFIEQDADCLDPAFVRLLRASGEMFVGRLVSGPGISSEAHSRDPSVLVRSQVSSRPLRAQPALTGEGGDDDSKGLDTEKAYAITTQVNYNLSSILTKLALARVGIWNVLCVRPNDSGIPNSFDKRRIRNQVRSLALVDLVGRKQHEWVHGWEFSEFLDRIGMTGSATAGGKEDSVRAIATGEGWEEGKDFFIGRKLLWVSWDAWRDIEDRSRVAEEGIRGAEDSYNDATDAPSTTAHTIPWTRDGEGAFGTSQEELNLYAAGGAGVTSAGHQLTTFSANMPSPGWNGSSEWDKISTPGESTPPILTKEGRGAMIAPEDIGKHGYANVSTVNFIPTKGTAPGFPGNKPVEVIPTTRTRRWWVRFVWLCTWWIPSFLLSGIGRMKRSDIRMAWREKVTIFLLILGLCGTVIFYVIIFGKLICPEFDFAWNIDELKGHTADNDFWVTISGSVYDISTFWKGDHSIPGLPMTQDVTRDFAGTDMTNYFPPPLELACAGLVTSDRLEMRYANASTVPSPPFAVHTSGVLQSTPGSDLNDPLWYTKRFLPRMKEFYKGPLVWDPKRLWSKVNEDGRVMAIYAGSVYDLSDYLQTLNDNNGGAGYNYLDSDLVDIFKQQPGQDVTKAVNRLFGSLSSNAVAANKACLNNRFLLGKTDFRKTPRCTAQGWLLVAFSAIIASTILVKFLAALQLGSKRTPELLDKFIICQVPCYTEGEDSLRRTIDSLAALKYDDKRKLLFIICDGNIVGSGNDRPTPRIVLDILGVDPSLDPEPLMFRSIGDGSKQLNYGKVYSGLYEFEGHVVPYMVVVKVGKPSERQRPGNRGKRDSQILLLHYLNRVHFDAPMYPLELEIYHQMRNVIGIDPAFYEYIFMVDADTTVTQDSLNRLVAVTSDDSSVIAVCGETRLDNEDNSWWTMIQVYEYYISHNLAKAFESLFGSVTCLPGCFSMYRIRTADKGRPLIISNRIIDEYSECNVDTLHKKNLLQLGEDRYLTTLMMKHFPTFRMKFTPDAIAHTVAPDRWSVLLSQRRRWINSTIHNLLELIGLGELCGFCCFSMRFVVFIDLLGTLILPATAVYLVYLITIVSLHKAPIPIVSLAMIGAVYGLQAIIFLLKREFMLIGWMIIYILAYPVYSFFLPLYSFWCMDDFSWGNTRIVVGEGRDKKVMYQDDEGFDESVIPLKKFSEYEAEAFEYNGSHHSQSGDSRPASRAKRERAQSHSHSHSPSQAGSALAHNNDYYRDTNLTHNNSSNPHLRLPPIHTMAALNASAHGSSVGSAPHLPNMPFGSKAPSDYGHGAPDVGGMHGFGYAGSGFGGSILGHGGPAAPRNSVMTNLNMFGGGGGMGMPGGSPPSAFPGMMGGPGSQRPMSTFSLATTVNPFAGGQPSQSTNPTDEELLSVLRYYLSTQDLMTVTKKTAREAIMARFPRADLSSKKDFLNQSIDRILTES